MIERIAELRGQAEVEIAAAGSAEALAELRVRYLGRKAELPQMLRGVAQLAPEQRGAVGKAANQARQALDALIEQRSSQLGGEELQERLRADRVDVTLAAEELVLRTHTSPMQGRAMEAHPPPLYVVIPGRVYRPDSDATHTPQFHQIEGLAVDEDITLADLKGCLLEFARGVFGDRRDVRQRPLE